jgi:flagellar motor switch protein FliN
VAETIEYEQFENPDGAAVAPHGEAADLRRLSEIPLELGVEIGRTQTTVGETLDLRVGSVIELEREAGEPADLLVNGTAIARGEVVVIDARYGLRITEILDAQEQVEHAAAVSAPQDPDAPAEGEPAPASDEPAAQAAAAHEPGDADEPAGS